MVQKISKNYKIALMFFLAFVISLGLIGLFEEKFDAEQWKSDVMHRYKMVDDLMESRILIQQSKSKVLTVLGPPNHKSNTIRDIFIYNIGDPPRFFNTQKERLLVIFKNQKVEEVKLKVDY